MPVISEPDPHVQLVLCQACSVEIIRTYLGQISPPLSQQDLATRHSLRNKTSTPTLTATRQSFTPPTLRRLLTPTHSLLTQMVPSPSIKMADVEVFEPLNYLMGACTVIGLWMISIQLDRAYFNMTMYDGPMSLFKLPEAPEPVQHLANIPGLWTQSCTPCLYYVSFSGEIRLMGRVPEEKCCPNKLMPPTPTEIPAATTTTSVIGQPSQQEPFFTTRSDASSTSQSLLGKLKRTLVYTHANTCRHELLLILIGPIMLYQALRDGS